MDDIRKNRMEHQIQEKISLLILSGSVKDPRVSTLLSITRVQVTNDFSYATVYVSSIQQDHSVEKAVEALNHAAGYIQNQLGKHLKTRNTPKLKFKHDTAIKDSFEMGKILEGLHHKTE
jgi:ribosome-binding factor A